MTTCCTWCRSNAAISKFTSLLIDPLFMLVARVMWSAAVSHLDHYTEAHEHTHTHSHTHTHVYMSTHKQSTHTPLLCSTMFSNTHQHHAFPLCSLAPLPHTPSTHAYSTIMHTAQTCIQHKHAPPLCSLAFPVRCSSAAWTHPWQQGFRYAPSLPLRAGTQCQGLRLNFAQITQ